MATRKKAPAKKAPATVKLSYDGPPVVVVAGVARIPYSMKAGDSIEVSKEDAVGLLELPGWRKAGPRAQKATGDTPVATGDTSDDG